MTNKDYPDPEKCFMYLCFAPPFFLDKSAENGYNITVFYNTVIEKEGSRAE